MVQRCEFLLRKKITEKGRWLVWLLICVFISTSSSWQANQINGRYLQAILLLPVFAVYCSGWEAQLWRLQAKIIITFNNLPQFVKFELIWRNSTEYFAPEFFCFEEIQQRPYWRSIFFRSHFLRLLSASSPALNDNLIRSDWICSDYQGNYGRNLRTSTPKIKTPVTPSIL
jgi:hypothetical protein